MLRSSWITRMPLSWTSRDPWWSAECRVRGVRQRFSRGGVRLHSVHTSMVLTDPHGAKRGARQLFLALISFSVIAASLLILKVAPMPFFWVLLVWGAILFAAIFGVERAWPRAILVQPWDRRNPAGRGRGILPRPRISAPGGYKWLLCS